MLLKYYIHNPRLAVAGLNPQRGERIVGREEVDEWCRPLQEQKQH